MELPDKSERGVGRLLLLVRCLGVGDNSRVVAEWYVRFYRNNKRRLTKIGTYPAMPLLEARRLFREDYAPVIRAGGEPTNPYARAQHKNAHLTVQGLFTAYVANLKRKGKKAWYAAERILLKRKDNAADAIGRHRLASSIEPGSIVAYLAGIHSRGKIGMANNVRGYVRSAFSFGLASEHSYTREVGDGKWGLKYNPAAAIPADIEAYKVGNRFLEPRELREFWEWLLDNQDRWFASVSLFLIAATGQRITEVLMLREQDYDKKERTLYWSVTKNGRPHSIPIPEIAAEILDGLTPSAGGWYFPHRFNPHRHAISTTPNKICDLYAEETGRKKFTPRDLRRTWKTLAGRAGISKEMRDRLQNHVTDNTVSARHYDRYDYLREKRAAMNRWNKFLARILRGELDAVVAKREDTRAA